MRKKLVLRVLVVLSVLLFCSLVAMAQGVELGYSDFPYTASDGNVISAALSGSYTSYSSAWTSCSVTTKANSIWLGESGTGTLTNSFTNAVSSVTYNVTASNVGETVTITTNAGTPTITATGCGYSIAGNVLTFTSDNYGGDGGAGAQITITSSSPFTQVQMDLYGNGSGSLVTMDYGGGSAANIPVSPWAIAALFAVISFVGYRILRKSAVTPA